MVKIGCALGILFLLFVSALGPIPPGNIGSPATSLMQTARQIGLLMFAYSTDHNGHYPDGRSSTEVFQKLLDGGYCSDPAIFYIPSPGKIAPIVRKKLKAENVCWDVTSGVDSHSPDSLPLVFMTGYKVTYAPNGSAVPVVKPYPQLEYTRTWTQWRYGMPLSITGIAVMYKGNNARFCNLAFGNNSEASVPNFVPTDFDAHGKIYRQLTPESYAGTSTAAVPPTLQFTPTAIPPVSGEPWINQWGMKFVPAGTEGVLFSIWDVRVKDFRAFVDVTDYDATQGMKPTQRGINWRTPGFPQSDDDPVVKVSWNDANAFCQWLTMKEQAEGKLTSSQHYRLPTDAEWSRAVGLNESADGSPGSKSRKIPGVFPWGTQWPPPDNAGNFNYNSVSNEGSTSPVGSYAPNAYGLYDMCGNVWQWCEDDYGDQHDHGVLRGGSWSYNTTNTLLSSFRFPENPAFRRGDVGFRIVLVVAP